MYLNVYFAKRSSLSIRRMSDLTLPERVQLPRIRVVTPSIWLEPSLFQATFLPLSQRICAIISTVDVLPLLPVTATIYFGSSIRPRISGQSLSAICPGRLLPLPSNPPTNFRTLHTIIVNSFFILPLP